MDKWAAMSAGQDERVRVALRANGLSSDGRYDECLERLMRAGSKKRKPSDGPSVVDVVKESMLTSVKANVSTLSPALKRTLCVELGIPIRSDQDVTEAIATALTRA